MRSTAYLFRNPPPRPLGRLLLGARRALLRLADAVVPPQLAIFDHATGVARTHCLGVAARLGVADRLAAGPRTAEDLAAELGVDASALRRVLRALAAIGVFEADGERFAQNARSEALRTGVYGSMRDFAIYESSAATALAWAELAPTGGAEPSAFERAHGVTVWEWFERHPAEAAVFASAMGSLSEIEAPAIAAGYPFREVGRLCDVGAGTGILAAELLARHPALRAVLLDAPALVSEAARRLAARGLAARAEPVAGSFFESVPEGCDAYLLKDVLHDWDDERSLRILENCRRAMRPGARLLVAEMLLERAAAEAPAALVDVQMMAVCAGGRQRGVADFRRLFERAGFELRRVLPTAATSSIVEGVAG